jgi:hypothetical protein
MLTFYRIFVSQMNLTVKISKTKLKYQLTTAVMICVSAVCFATLGDGKQKRTSGKQSLLTPRPTYNYKQFSLRSTYQYRGSDLLKAPIPSNNLLKGSSLVTYQKGNTTYILPMKKKVILDKVKFNPATPRY